MVTFVSVLKVWFHGGGFITGSGDDPLYEEETLAAYGDVILVTVNYRLGVFGFFYTGDDRMENGKINIHATPVNQK